MTTCSPKRASQEFMTGPSRAGRKEAMPAQHRAGLAGALIVVPAQPAGGGCAVPSVQRQPAEHHRGNPIAGPRSIPAVACPMSVDVVSYTDTPGGYRAVAIIMSDDFAASAPSLPFAAERFTPAMVNHSLSAAIAAAADDLASDLSGDRSRSAQHRLPRGPSDRRQCRPPGLGSIDRGFPSQHSGERSLSHVCGTETPGTVTPLFDDDDGNCAVPQYVG